MFGQAGLPEGLKGGRLADIDLVPANILLEKERLGAGLRVDL